MSFDANPTRRRRRRGFANSQIARQYNSARIYGRRVSSYFWVYASGRPNTRRKWRHERMGINDVRRVCPQRNANSNANATAAWRDSPDLRTCQTRSNGPRVLSVDTRAPVYNQRDCNWGCAEFNRILIFLFVWRRMCRTRAANIARIHEKCSIYYRYLTLVQASPVWQLRGLHF